MIDVPFPLAWSHPLSGTTAFCPPVLDGPTLFIRSGSTVKAIDAATGLERWSWEPEVDSDSPQNLGVADGIVFTTYAVTLKRLKKWTSRLIALRDGRELWRRELEGTIARDGAVFHDGFIHAVVRAHDGRDLLWKLNPTTGEGTFGALAKYGSTVLSTSRGLVSLGAGALLLSPDGNATTTLRDADISEGHVSGDRLVTAGERKRDRAIVEVLDLTTAKPLWRDETFNAVTAVEGDDVAHATGGVNAAQLVLRDASTGTLRWTAELGATEPVKLTLLPELVLLNHMLGLRIFDRASGRLLADLPLGSDWSFGSVRNASHLFLLNVDALVAVDPVLLSTGS